MNAQEIYNSCKKLLFKVDLIVKDAKGEVLINKRLSKFSEIFNEQNRPIISKVCS